MIFHSLNYIFLFLPITLTLYNLSPYNKLRNIILILSSYVFYAWGNPYLALLLFSSSIIDFQIGKKIDDANRILDNNLNSKRTKEIKKRKKYLLIISIFFNIGILFFFKYWDWFLGVSILALSKLGLNIFEINAVTFQHQIQVPPGISFYTFQTLSYTIDIFRGQFKSQKSIIDYFTFVSFFPQLIAGPIERAKDLLPQLKNLRNAITSEMAENAIFLIFWGLFKKLVFADNLGHLVERCLENIETPGLGITLLIAFSFQIYCDFSAYTDIARGTASLFGINLKHNFLTPYFSINPSDFWKRWHISLSKWVRDYIYIPMGGNRNSIIKNTFNVLLTMAIMGLWHGARKFFLFWGIYNGFLLVLYRILPIDKYCIKFFGNHRGRIIAVLFMYSFTLFGWLLFFARDNASFTLILNSVFSTFSLIYSSSELINNFYSISYGLLIFCLPILITEFIGYKFNKEFVDVAQSMRTEVKFIIYLIMIYGILFIGSRGSYDFIYFQF